MSEVKDRYEITLELKREVFASSEEDAWIAASIIASVLEYQNQKSASGVLLNPKCKATKVDFIK